jgi:hypothetical protein
MDRFAAAIAAIDARNADDPNLVGSRPKELVHAEMVTGWVRRLTGNPGEALLLAARAHHVRRWEIPRASFPEGRIGYLQWRRTLQDHHAAELRKALVEAGYDGATIDRAEWILRKRDPAHDPDAQALEDALCLTFVETQLAEVGAKLGRDKTVNVLRKTFRKMSPRAIALAGELPLPEDARVSFAEALQNWK